MSARGFVSGSEANENNGLTVLRQPIIVYFMNTKLSSISNVLPFMLSANQPS